MPGNAMHERVRQARCVRADDNRAWRRARDTPLRARSRKPPTRAHVGRDRARAASAAAPKPAIAATFSVPARRPPLLAAARDEAARAPAPSRDDQRADALRSADLVRRQRQEIDAELRDIDRRCGPAAWTASVWRSALRACAARRPRRPAAARRSRCWPSAASTKRAAGRIGQLAGCDIGHAPIDFTGMEMRWAPDASAAASTDSCSMRSDE